MLFRITNFTWRTSTTLADAWKKLRIEYKPMNARTVVQLSVLGALLIIPLMSRDGWCERLGRDRIFWMQIAAMLKGTLDSQKLSAAVVTSSIRVQMEVNDRTAEEEAVMHVGRVG
jgi:hypothetical protein